MNAVDLWQFTPLHEAASKSRVEVCSLLLAHGADPHLVNCHSKSIIDVAPTRELQERIQCKDTFFSLLPVQYFFPNMLIRAWSQAVWLIL